MTKKINGKMMQASIKMLSLFFDMEATNADFCLS